MDAKDMTILMTFGGSMLGIVGFVIGNTRAEAEKRARIYSRIDEVKECHDKTFVRKDICDTTHKYVSETLYRIENKLDKLLEPTTKGQHG